MNTPTPRTDALRNKLHENINTPNIVKYMETVLHSNELETELKAVTQQLTKAHETIGTMIDQIGMLQLKDKATTEQRDRLAEAIVTHRAKAFPLTGEDFDQELWEALQSLDQPNNA